MKTLPWFRMYSDFMFDEKIEFIAFEDQRHYVFILCMKNAGVLDKEYAQPGMLERVVSKRLGLYGEAFESAKKRLIDSGLIDSEFHPVAWDKRQFLSDSSAERVKAYRDRLKKDVKRPCNVTVTVQETDTETETEADTDKTVGFASFWSTYPKKIAKPNAIKAFKAAKLKTGEIDSILTDIDTRKQSDDWTKENGKYIPNPATYLNQRRWEDGETAHTSSYANVMAGAI